MYLCYNPFEPQTATLCQPIELETLQPTPIKTLFLYTWGCPAKLQGFNHNCNALSVSLLLKYLHQTYANRPAL